MNGRLGRALSAGRLYREKRGNGPARWMLDYTGADGRRHRQALSTDKSVAERMRIEIMRERDLANAGLGTIEGQSRPIAEVVKLYLEDLPTRATPQHIRNVRAHLTTFFADVRVERVRDLIPHHVLAHRRRQLAAGSSHETQNHRLRAVKAMLTWAVAAGLIAKNPVEHVKCLPVGEKHARRQRRALSDEEIERLLEAADDDDRRQQARLSASASIGGGTKGARWENLVRRERIPQAALFRTLAFTGCRYGELTRATWFDIDFGARTLTLRGTSTKSGRTRVLPLRSTLVFELQSLRAMQERVLGAPGPRIFLAPEGVPWPEPSRNALRILYRVMKRAGIARRDEHGHVIDLHALRHSFASQLARDGVGLAQAQRLLGHADIAMTAKVYTHLGVEDLRDAVERRKPTDHTNIAPSEAAWTAKRAIKQESHT